MEDFNNCINNCGTVKIRTMDGKMSFFLNEVEICLGITDRKAKIESGPNLLELW